MSKFSRKTSLALALAAAFALTAPVMAATVTDTTNHTYANNVATTDIAAATITLQPMQVNIVGSDQIIGRSTGFAMRIDLAGGATFGAAVTPPTVGPALPSGWTSAIGAGGNPGDNYVVITFTPGSGAANVTAGVLATFTGLGVAAATNSTSVTGTVSFYDPVTTQTILNSIPVNFLGTANPLAYSIGTPGNTVARIDVGSDPNPSKTGFSLNGSLNGSPRVQYFDAGTVMVGVAPNVLDASGNTFAWVNTGTQDKVDLTLTGNFAAFAATGGSISLSTGDCSSAPGAITATITGNTADFGNQNFSDVNNAELCFVAPGGSQIIDATSVQTSVKVTRSAYGTSVSGTANAQPLQYNGPVATVWTFNPASNTSMQSFLRVTNDSTTAGMFTITGTDDTGAAGASAVTFTLQPGETTQLTAQVLENGGTGSNGVAVTGALGAGQGKWRLVVTGEVGSMKVTNLNRSLTNDMITNLGNPVDMHLDVTTFPYEIR